MLQRNPSLRSPFVINEEDESTAINRNLNEKIEKWSSDAKRRFTENFSASPNQVEVNSITHLTTKLQDTRLSTLPQAS